MPDVPTLTESEMIEILENIARNGTNAAARIAAIKQLREMNDGKVPASGGFDELDQGANVAQIRRKAA